MCWVWKLINLCPPSSHSVPRSCAGNCWLKAQLFEKVCVTAAGRLINSNWHAHKEVWSRLGFTRLPVQSKSNSQTPSPEAQDLFPSCQQNTNKRQYRSKSSALIQMAQWNLTQISQVMLQKSVNPFILFYTSYSFTCWCNGTHLTEGAELMDKCTSVRDSSVRRGKSLLK